MRSAHSYKAATYLSSGKPNDLWTGHAIDKQINHGSKVVADYWIVDFLKSEFATTAATGTKRLAVALKTVMTATSDPTVKREITSAVNLSDNIPQKAMTIRDFCDNFHFSPKTRDAIMSAVNPSRLVHEKFKFDNSEFSRHIAYKQVELDNGAVLTAPVERFDACFKRTKKKDAHT